MLPDPWLPELPGSSWAEEEGGDRLLMRKMPAQEPTTFPDATNSANVHVPRRRAHPISDQKMGCVCILGTTSITNWSGGWEAVQLIVSSASPRKDGVPCLAVSTGDAAAQLRSERPGSWYLPVASAPGDGGGSLSPPGLSALQPLPS